jgi:hypothetical protein
MLINNPSVSMGLGFRHGCSRVPEVELFQYCKPIFYARSFSVRPAAFVVLTSLRAFPILLGTTCWQRLKAYSLKQFERNNFLSNVNFSWREKACKNIGWLY